MKFEAFETTVSKTSGTIFVLTRLIVRKDEIPVGNYSVTFCFN